MKIEFVCTDRSKFLSDCKEILFNSGFMIRDEAGSYWRGIRNESGIESTVVVDMELNRSGQSDCLDIHATRLNHRTALLEGDQLLEERLAAELLSILS